MELEFFQECIKKTYFEKDSHRGIQGTFLWFMEEIGELARSIRKGNQKEKEEEFADVFAWLVSLANLCNINLDQASRKYVPGCPKCEARRCVCEE
ncbi:MAG: MazG nucleotide pyrophosphohydrolase domain-containing protein [Pseudomonadota bacterium]